MDSATVVALFGIVIAAAAGVAGAFLGARIAATATRQAAELAQAEARADREEARRARFADRIRELTGELIALGNRMLVSVNGQVVARHADPTGRPPVIAIDPVQLTVLVQELRLLVRLPDTVSAVQEYGEAHLAVARFAVRTSEHGVYHVVMPSDEDDRAFDEAKQATYAASARLEAAIARDLGTHGEG